MTQQQKHQQAMYYDKSANDLHSLETGNTVHGQLVPNVRMWVSVNIIENISDRAFKVKTLLGVVYVRKHTIRHTDSRQSLKTAT